MSESSPAAKLNLLYIIMGISCSGKRYSHYINYSLKHIPFSMFPVPLYLMFNLCYAARLAND